MGAVDAFFAKLTLALRVVGQVVLAFMVVTICYDSLMRYGLAAPTSWSLEINTFLIIYIAVMTAAAIQRDDEHIRITFFTSRAGPGTQRVIRAVIGLVGVAFCTIMAWRGGMMTMQAIEYGERVSSGFGTPTAFPYAMLPIGFGALAVQFLLDAIGAFRAGTGSPERG